MPTVRERIDRTAAIAWYLKNRARTAAIFDALSDSAYYAQPISLRHPIVFYEGHLPAFSLNTLVKKALGRSGVDPALETLFARGIDPEETREPGQPFSWPERSIVRGFVDAADALVIDALEHADLDVPGHPLLDASQAVYSILEHEAMHQETLLYMWHRLPFAQKRAPADYGIVVGHEPGENDRVPVPAGPTRLGAARGDIPFGWDNEFGPLDLHVDAFTIDRGNVTNGEFLEFVISSQGDRGDQGDASQGDQGGQGGASQGGQGDQGEGRGSHVPAFWEQHDGRWYWRGMFELIPLPLSWPVYVSHEAAAAYARWRGGRLPTEAEYQRAAYGSPSGAPRAFPWGDAPPDASRGVFDFASWEPHPAGTHAAGRSAWGIDDLVGNGWEWTSSIFEPFPGFTASPSYPEYSADFFDRSHYVMKGASPATAKELIRPTFRNWFRPRYPYVYATFRLVWSGTR